MGANMQRQAVPLLKAERPLVGTGLEEIVARDSKAIMVAQESGIVASATAEEIIITRDGKMPAANAPAKGFQHYHLYKFLRSNASTLVNQRPIVKRGDKVKKGQAIADGTCTDGGELALGRNVMVASCLGAAITLNAIIISERLVQEDVYTVSMSVRRCSARYKVGPEEITRISNVGESLRNLDTEGVIRLGSVSNR